MTQKMTTRMLLESGLNRGTLSSLFIDLQKAYYCEETRQTYERAAQLSSALKTNRVRNEYAVWPKETQDLKQRSLSQSAGSLTLEGQDAFPLVTTPQGYETVHIKPGFSVLSNTAYSDRITNEYAPYVIVAGVLANACVKYTLRDILNQNARAQVVLAHDAINLEGRPPEEYAHAIATITKDAEAARPRIHTAAVREIEGMLSAIYY